MPEAAPPILPHPLHRHESGLNRVEVNVVRRDVAWLDRLGVEPALKRPAGHAVVPVIASGQVP